MGLRDRLKRVLVALTEDEKPAPVVTETRRLSEADIRRLVAESITSTLGKPTSIQMEADSVVAEPRETESNSSAAAESNAESNSSAATESNIIDPTVAKRRRGMIERVRRLREAANWPPTGRHYYETVNTYDDNGEPITVKRSLGFVEDSMASLCDAKTHPWREKTWDRERPSKFPDHYGVVDGVVVESPYVQMQKHLPTDHGWLSVLRQDIPADMLDRHDYYASFGMRGWLAPDGDRYAIVYWSPDPANWADEEDRPVAAWPQETPATVGTVSFNDVAAHMSEDDAPPTVRQFAHRVGHVDQPFAGARATWGRQLPPRASAPIGKKKLEFIFNMKGDEQLTLGDVRR